MKFFRALGIGFLVSWVLVSCSGSRINDNDPAALYKDAEEDISGSNHIAALEKLRIIKNKFPYSSYSKLALLRIGDVYFLQEAFGEAAAQYETFRDLYPKHEKSSYALFRIGKSYFEDTPGNIARDLSSAVKAMEAYNDYLKVYPSGPESDEARKDLKTVREKLAAKGFYVASFYIREDAYDSAKTRLEKLISLYPETSEAAKAREKLVEVNQELAKIESR